VATATERAIEEQVSWQRRSLMVSTLEQ
jgi:hypothetical protein